MALCDEATQARLTGDMLRLPAIWKSTTNLARWSRFIQLVNKRLGVGAARYLIHKAGLSEGFKRLKDAGRLDLTVEYLMLQPAYACCFTAEERGLARQRLVENGMPRGQLPLESEYECEAEMPARA